MKKLSVRELFFLVVAVCSLLFATWRPSQEDLQHSQSDLLKNGERLSERETSKSFVSNGKEVKETTDPYSRFEKELEEFGVTPERAKIYVKEIEAIENIDHRAFAYIKLIRSLCESGYDLEAWEIISDEPGIVRTKQISAYFYNSSLGVDHAMEKIKFVEDPLEQTEALQSMIGGNFEKFHELLNHPDFVALTNKLVAENPESLASILNEGLGFAYGEADEENKEIVTQTFLDLRSKGLIRDNDLALMVARNSSSQKGWELWDWVADSSMGRDNPESFAGQTRESLLNGVISADAPRALEKIVSSKSDQSLGNLYDGFQLWASKEPNVAYEWYSDKKSQLTADQRDMTAKSFADLALNHGELSGAESWALQIENLEVREEILRKINPSQEDEE